MTIEHTANGNPRGTRQEIDALRGTGLLQSRDEWAARNDELSGSLNQLIRLYRLPKTNNALDVGCMSDELMWGRHPLCPMGSSWAQVLAMMPLVGGSPRDDIYQHGRTVDLNLSKNQSADVLSMRFIKSSSPEAHN
jgi:hypothetical protein